MKGVWRFLTINLNEKIMNKVRTVKTNYILGIPKTDKVVFFICLTVTLGLIVGGFFVPPTGIIDGSVLTASGIIFAFAALAIAAQAIQDGKKAIINHGTTHIEINDDSDEDSQSAA